MRIEYQMTPEDLKKAFRWRPPESRKRGRRGLLGWLVFVAAAAAMFVVLKTSPPTGPSPAATPPLGNQPGNFANLVQPFIPWLLIFLFVWVFVFRSLKARWKRAWDQMPELQQPHTVEFEDQGVRITNPMTESLYRWICFTSWNESKDLLLLALSGNRRLIIPRRAAASESEWRQLTALVARHVREPVGGFPVLMPLPVQPVEPPPTT